MANIKANKASRAEKDNAAAIQNIRSDIDASARAACIKAHDEISQQFTPQEVVTGSFNARIAHWKGLLARSTDAATNIADPYGDGDQSAVVISAGKQHRDNRNIAAGKASILASAGQALVEVWSCGADFNPVEMPDRVSKFVCGTSYK